MKSLREHSIEVILNNQSESGAYPASPNFPTYQYCWFRDGAFTAYAMDLVGEHQSATRFHAWAAANILARGEVIMRAMEKARAGQPLDGADILHTRYTLTGDDAEEDWPNFQLDGFGTWLWALEEHRKFSRRPLAPDLLAAGKLAAEYLSALWARPCYDCWEEYPDRVHPHTLGAIFGGLKAYAAITGVDQPVGAQIRAFLDTNAVVGGQFVKYLGTEMVDASLVGLGTPYRVYALDDPRLEATVAAIACQLAPEEGVHRYQTDTYYGGGEWVLLTAWLGWHYVNVGELEKARTALRWVENQISPDGDLPEQVPLHLNDPSYYHFWQTRWGKIATPLLWSHAMYLILLEAIKRV